MHRFLSCRGPDRVKNSARRAAENEFRRLENEFKKDEEEAEKEQEEIEKKLNEAYSQLKARANELKHTKYALGMNPENLSDGLKDKLKIIEISHPDIYTAYQLKEELRAILRMKSRELAQAELDK
ncbi:DesA/ISL3 alpha bundle tail domain-containing protein [Catenisphaera adipataccumulans]|uniref:Lon protease-like protein n=1 Tax=Catenisphaera adipataccumulans TaxID=700500 RepID=A0A7W8CWD5_9FIRM|nr:transposase [Catenisphaera adipataccumulans]MBB5182820.1 Lon protease-like protein [Catenisphaera adipataccumulans]